MTTINDNITYNLYKKRNEMYGFLIDSYKIKRDYFNEIIKGSNMKRLYILNLLKNSTESSDINNLIIEAYTQKVRLLREQIVAANMEFIHLKSMIDKVTCVKNLNMEQLNNYNSVRELEILKLSNGLSGDWTDSEKKTIDEYKSNMTAINDELNNNINNICNKIYNPYDNIEGINDTDKNIQKLNKSSMKKMMKAQSLQNELKDSCDQIYLSNSHKGIGITKGEQYTISPFK